MKLKIILGTNTIQMAMLKRISCLMIIALIVFSCKTTDDNTNTESELIDSIMDAGELEVPEQTMEDIVQNISSPVEMAALIKALGVPFSKKYLAPVDHADNYNTSFSQALGLGVYGADLGYLNMYNKTSSVLDYISTIKTLSDAIKVGQFFDFSTLKRLATNNTNLDSLMYISVHSFNEMDRYLRENKRGNLSTLIVAGVWIEGLYLATQVAKEKYHPDLAERIGEQKLILGDLMIILGNYSRDKRFKELIADFEEIKSKYKGVTITYEMGEPEAVEKDGMLMIIQNEKSIVHITEQQLNEIIETTERIRNKVISR